ncbi:uncharacterized protein [Lolium perenne]|uniref:uncharacterized protein n=1 Tax=Lolium perenne TaxID=4522 RepID=UPI003A98F25A
MSPPPPVIPREAWAGCSVILDINDGDRVIFRRLTRRATVNIGGRECSLQPLVGRPFGSIFRVEPCEGEPGKGNSLFGRLFSCADAPPPDHYDDDGDTDDVNDDVVGDGDDDDDARDDDETQHIKELDENRDNSDNNTAQALSGDDIETMKRNSVSGNAIVEALIANSSTFGKKTLQSQEKYKLKKQKKHAPILLLRRPSTQSICETHSKKDADRIGFMRLDVLSLLLSMANVGAYSDVLVVDMVGGLVVGAVAERLGGTGYVCSTYLGLSPNSIDIIRLYNFSTDVTSRKKTSGLQPPEGGTHTHTTVLTKRLQLGKEVPSTTNRNDIRPRLALPPTKNGEAVRLGTTGQRHRHCQTLPGTIAAPRLPRPTYLAPIMCQESASGRQGLAGTGVAIVGRCRLWHSEPRNVAGGGHRPAQTPPRQPAAAAAGIRRGRTEQPSPKRAAARMLAHPSSSTSDGREEGGRRKETEGEASPASNVADAPWLRPARPRSGPDRARAPPPAGALPPPPTGTPRRAATWHRIAAPPPSFPSPTPCRLAARATRATAPLRAKELRQGAPHTQPPAFGGRAPPPPPAAMAAREAGNGSPFSDLYSLRNPGNASCVLSDTIHAENLQTVDVEVSEPSVDEHLNQSGNPFFIVAAPEHEVGSLVTDLLPLLSYSAPFAVYHQHLEPLATCMRSLKVSKMAVELHISEPWFREYQVLPSRTHPHMRMKPFGGYLLSGIRIPDTCSGK